MMSRAYYLLLLLVLTGLTACQASPPQPQYHQGAINQQQLLTEHPTFAEEFNAYQPSQRELNAVQQLQGKSLLVLFGTWCHDSEREVPRLLKLLQQSKVQLKALRLIAVDLSKSDPQGYSQQYQLKYTPTFILLKDGKEIGRVVERPVNSLAEDLAALTS